MTTRSLTDRDFDVTGRCLADKIAALRPLIALADEMGGDWRPAFLADAERCAIRANGRPASSAGSQEANEDATALRWLVEEDRRSRSSSGGAA